MQVRKNKQAPILEKVLIEDYAAEGKSLARVDGKVIFVEGAVPGDVVDIQLQKNKADWAEGFAKTFHSYRTKDMNFVFIFPIALSHNLTWLQTLDILW